jgi:ergothioneine biosynthesis protein EgtB
MTMSNPASSAINNRRRVSASEALNEGRARWLESFRTVRRETERRAAPLSPEDQVIQSMPDASPIKWHRAHTTWFFEQFLLVPHASGYRAFDDRFPFLFNSYYVSAGPRHARPQRGLVTRPGAAEVAAYRAHVDRAVEALVADCDGATFKAIAPILEIGLHHEQQHQELMWTDILHAFAQNPTSPAYDPAWAGPQPGHDGSYLSLGEGIYTVGHDGTGFAFDNESPAHRALVGPVRIARALVTNREWLAFIDDGGYATPTLWLSDGWATVVNEGWTAPCYWRAIDGAWFTMTLAGLKPVDPDAAVCHVSYYEADAFARWAGKHLPSEEEWEVAARLGGLGDADGIVWQWTRSAYAAYPGYRAAPGTLGEYNGKFMVSQMVLRGSSFATPSGHSRVSYRNFFYPPARWQFTGLRLAEFGG